MEQNPSDVIEAIQNAARTGPGPDDGTPTMALRVTQDQANLLLLALEEYEHQLRLQAGRQDQVGRCQALWNLVFSIGREAGFRERE